MASAPGLGGARSGSSGGADASIGAFPGFPAGVGGESLVEQAKRSEGGKLGVLGAAISSLVDGTGSFLPVLLTVLALVAAAIVVVIRRRRVSAF